MILQILLLVVGFIVLVKGADVFVEGVSNIAKSVGLSTTLIALTVVAFATSTPELIISINSIISGNNDMALSHILGTNTLNILFVIGICSLIKPIVIKNDTVKKEMPILILISTLLPILFFDNLFSEDVTNQISRNDGVAILLFFMIFVYYLMVTIKYSKLSRKIEKPKYSMKKAISISILGLLAIIVGGDLIVDNAVIIAKTIGMTERVISLTIIAFGTSLTEIVTGIIAVRKNEQDIVIGNIVGTNIFNIGVVIGLPVMLFGAIAPTEYNIIDSVMLILSSFLLYVFARNDKKITKREGIIMLIIFFAYYTYILI